MDMHIIVNLRNNQYYMIFFFVMNLLLSHVNLRVDLKLQVKFRSPFNVVEILVWTIDNYYIIDERDKNKLKKCTEASIF